MCQERPVFSLKKTLFHFSSPFFFKIPRHICCVPPLIFLVELNGSEYNTECHAHSRLKQSNRQRFQKLRYTDFYQHYQKCKENPQNSRKEILKTSKFTSSTTTIPSGTLFNKYFKTGVDLGGRGGILGGRPSLEIEN